MARHRSKYFWRMVDGRLEAGDSITQIASGVGITFNEIWGRFRSNPQLSRKGRVHTWLEREEDKDATARLEKIWPQIAKSYTAKQGVSKPTPNTLAIRWGVKSSMIADKLREEGLMEGLSILEALASITAGETIETAIQELLS
jgi:hypothetical protein